VIRWLLSQWGEALRSPTKPHLQRRTLKVSMLLMPVSNRSDIGTAEARWICATSEHKLVLKTFSTLKRYSSLPLQWVSGDVMTHRFIAQPHFQSECL